MTDRPQPTPTFLALPPAGDVPAWQRVGPWPECRRTEDPLKNARRAVLSETDGRGAPILRAFHRTSVRFAVLAFAEQKRVLDLLDRLRVPTLVVHGGDDRLVPTASSERLAHLPGVTRRVPGLRHEVHNGPRSEVVDEIAAWLRSTLADRAEC